jgi:hypothetical protein
LGALASSVSKEKAGAGLPIKGDGISLGSRFKPTARKMTRPKKNPRGIKNFFTTTLSM